MLAVKTRVTIIVILLLMSLLCTHLHAQVTPVEDSDPTPAQHCANLATGNEHAHALKTVCVFALSFQQKLPNYICDERIKRWDTAADFRNPDNSRMRVNASQATSTDFDRRPELRLNEVIDTQVTVEDGKDSYSNTRVNGKPSDKMLPQMPGMLSAGEFGMQLQHLFEPENNARFEFKKEVKVNSRPTLLFEFKIREGDNKSFNVWDVNSIRWEPGYSGSMWVDAKTLQPVRLDIKSTRMPFKTVIQNVEASTEYGDIALADGTTFLLPIKSTAVACGAKRWDEICFRNELVFTNCHKFRAEAQILSTE